MQFKKALGVFSLSATLVLSGCASGSFGSAKSSLDSGDDAQFFSSSGWGACGVGALTGALGGALAGQAIGKDTTSTVAGAAIGAVAGCGVGMGANYYLEKQRTQYAKKEDRLKAYIADVQQNSEMVSKATAKLNSVTTKNKALMAQLNAQLKSGAIKQADAKKQLAQVDADIKAGNERLAKMKENLQQFQNAAKQDNFGTKGKALDRDITKLSKQIQAYEGALNAQAKQRSALQVG